MRNSILLTLAVSFIVFVGCGDKSETSEDKEAPKDEVIVQTQEPVEKPDAQDVKEEDSASVQEIFITIKEGKFEPTTIVIKKGEKVKFKVKSLDVQHTFTCATLGIKETVNAGEEIVVEFTPVSTAKFVTFGCDIHGYFIENGTMTIN